MTAQRVQDRLFLWSVLPIESFLHRNDGPVCLVTEFHP